MTDLPAPAALTPQQLDEYTSAIAVYERHAPTGFDCCTAHPAADAARALFAEVRRLHTELAASRAQAWRDLADRAHPAGEASWFGDFGPQVAAWMRDQADHEDRAAAVVPVASTNNETGADR